MVDKVIDLLRGIVIPALIFGLIILTIELYNPIFPILLIPFVFIVCKAHKKINEKEYKNIKTIETLFSSVLLICFIFAFFFSHNETVEIISLFGIAFSSVILVDLYLLR